MTQLMPWSNGYLGTDPAELIRTCRVCGEDYSPHTPCACPVEEDER